MTGTFEGVGTLQFTTDNKYCYAYSPITAFSDDAATLLEFTTGSEYNIVDVLYMRSDSDSLDSAHRVYFNGTQIASLPLASGGAGRGGPNTLVIPPFTLVKIDVVNTSNTSNGSGLVSLSGKVGGAIQQINLESITDDNKWASL